MPSQSWSGLLNAGPPWQTTQGTALTTAVTATISPQSPGGTIKDFAVQPWFIYPGAVFRLTAKGFLTTTAVSTTATIFAAAGANVVLATPVGLTTGTTVATGIQWEWESISRITAIASTGVNTVSTQGSIRLANLLAAVPSNPTLLTQTPGMTLGAPNASGETVAQVDTSSAMSMMMRGTLAGASATIQCTQFLIESLN